MRSTLARCSTMSVSETSSAVGSPASPAPTSVGEPSGPSVTMRNPSGRCGPVSMPSVMKPSSPTNRVRTHAGSAKVGAMAPDPVVSTAALPGLRAVAADDAEELLRLVEACDVADDGEVDYTLEDVVDDLSRPSWRGWVVERDGRFVAHGWVEQRDNQTTIHADVRVRPEAEAALATPLLALVREEAARLDPGGAVHVPVSVNAHRARRWLAHAGGTVVRHFWRMVVELDAVPPPPPPPPPVPAGVTVEQPRDDVAELRNVHSVIDTAFLDHFGSVPTQFDAWLHRQRTSPGADLGLWWMARVDGVPAAVLIGRMWPDTGWVQGVGTLPAYRGRGLARLLLVTAFGEYFRRGQPRVSLGVDAESPTRALALYESVGMHRALEVLMVELPA